MLCLVTKNLILTIVLGVGLFSTIEWKTAGLWLGLSTGAAVLTIIGFFLVWRIDWDHEVKLAEEAVQQEVEVCGANMWEKQ